LYVIAITGWVCRIFCKSGSLAPVCAETRQPSQQKKTGRCRPAFTNQKRREEATLLAELSRDAVQ
jgi:hypothetical protein